MPFDIRTMLVREMRSATWVEQVSGGILSMPARRPVDVWMHLPTYICVSAPKDVPNVFNDFQMPDVGTDFKCELKSTRRLSDAKTRRTLILTWV